MSYAFSYTLLLFDGTGAGFTVTTAEAPAGGPYNATGITGNYRGLAITGLNSTYLSPENVLGEGDGYANGLSPNGISFSLSDGTAAYVAPGSDSGHFRVVDTGNHQDRTEYYSSNANIASVTSYSTTAPRAAACFLAGTSIRTPDRELPVDLLREGDLVVTQSGTLRPVRWVGHSIVHPPHAPDPSAAHPIRVRAHAFADGVPSRDLLVSPGHALLVGDVLINAGELVNGGTIVQEEVGQVDYYHVELDSHDILIAEGLPCESYLDDGNRASFINGADHIRLHGRIDRVSAETCRPLVKSGPLLVAARADLLARAIALGWVLAEAPELRLVVGGAAIAPVAEAGRTAWFLLPAGHDGAVRLRSAAAIVNRIAPDLADGRRLGVAIGALRVDGADVALDDAAFGGGCYPPESDGVATWRWIDGDAALTLPAGARMIELRLQIVLPTLRRAEDVAAARAA